MATCIEHQREIEILMQEFQEYKSQAKDYEDALEAEITEKDEKIASLIHKLDYTDSEYKNLRKMYEANSLDLMRALNETDALKKRLRSFEEQKRDLEVLNDQWEKSARVLEYSKQELEDRLNQVEEMAILYKEEIDELTFNKEAEMQRLKDQYNELKQELAVASVDRSDSNSPKKPKVEIVTLNEGIFIPSKPQSKNASKANSRAGSRAHSRKNSSDSNDCSQSVKVVVRVRPSLKDEIWDKSALSISGSSINIKEQKPKSELKSFEFENIVSPDQNEDIMFSHILPGVNSVKSGKNACIMAYGQTGSGKTYTMNSVVKYSIDQLESFDNAEVSLQCIEVYNECIKNLFSDNKATKDTEAPEIILSQNWGSHAKDLIADAIAKRTTKFTDCNERSSRSHAIFTLTFKTKEFTSKIQFVDLAGSERVGKSNVSGETLKEALLINKSLSALQDVITALECKQKHVPYRNSTLTKILQPTLGGSQSMVTMIINCSPCIESLSETLCTLALATRVKAVDLGFFIRKNLNTKEVERTLTLLEKERTEKNALLRTLDKLQRDLESYQFAVKDRDSKITMLNNKIKLREKTSNEFKVQTKVDVKPIMKKIKGKQETCKLKNRNLIHLNINEISRVVSLSPTLIFPSSPNITQKPTRIPGPNSISLKMGHNS